MSRTIIAYAALVILASSALAQAPDEAPSAPEDDVRTPAGEAVTPEGEESRSLGMSILGNQEAPTSLVIVPWKSSEIGDGVSVSRALDTSIRPVDKEVFLRELSYYQIRASGE